jgi:hypothetical protein
MCHLTYVGKWIKINSINRLHIPMFLLGSASVGTKLDRTCMTLTRFSADVKCTVHLAYSKKYSQLNSTKSLTSAVLAVSLFLLLAIIRKHSGI